MSRKYALIFCLFILTLLLLPGVVSAQVIQGETPTGTKKNVQVDATGHLITSPSGGSMAADVRIRDGVTPGTVTTVAKPNVDSVDPATIYDLNVLSDNRCLDTNSKMSRVKCGASGGIQIEKISTLSYTPTKTTTSTIAGTLVDVLASVAVIYYPNFCVTLKNNDAANPLTDAAILQSPDGTSWESLSWTACDTLAHGALCSYCVSGNAYRYIKVQAAAGAVLTVSSVDAWLTANTN